MVRGGEGGGAYPRDKNTTARLRAKNAGGAYARGGAYLRDTTVQPVPLVRMNSGISKAGTSGKHCYSLTITCNHC